MSSTFVTMRALVCGANDCPHRYCALGHLLVDDLNFDARLRIRGALLCRPPWDHAGYRGTEETLTVTEEGQKARIRWGQTYFGLHTGGDPEVPFAGQPVACLFMLRNQGLSSNRVFSEHAGQLS